MKRDPENRGRPRADRWSFDDPAPPRHDAEQGARYFDDADRETPPPPRKQRRRESPWAKIKISDRAREEAAQAGLGRYVGDPPPRSEMPAAASEDRPAPATETPVRPPGAHMDASFGAEAPAEDGIGGQDAIHEATPFDHSPDDPAPADPSVGEPIAAGAPYDAMPQRPHERPGTARIVAMPRNDNRRSPRHDPPHRDPPHRDPRGRIPLGRATWRSDAPQDDNWDEDWENDGWQEEPPRSQPGFYQSAARRRTPWPTILAILLLALGAGAMLHLAGEPGIALFERTPSAQEAAIPPVPETPGAAGTVNPIEVAPRSAPGSAPAGATPKASDAPFIEAAP